MKDEKQSGKQLRPLTNKERQFATENYYLIDRFLKIKKADPETYFDIVVFDFMLSVQVWLTNAELRQKTKFEAVSFKYMERALLNEYKSRKAKKRSSEAGADVSYENAEIDGYLQGNSAEGAADLEYRELIKYIESKLTEEQGKIFSDRPKGYTLKEIAQNHEIGKKRVYKQFAKVKGIVAEIMEI